MKKKELVTKILAGLLVAGMLIGLLPMFASAAETDSENSSLDNLHLNKTAVLQDDGTWTITLEAYATGTVEAVVTKQVTPTDIILVLDQSGSMSSESIMVAGGHQLATGVTNANLLNRNNTYYYYDANDNKYYPVTITKQVAVQDSYWYVYSIDDNGNEVLSDTKYLASATDKVATSWTAGGRTVNFDDGYGYLVDDYLIYQSTVGVFESTDVYGYELASKGNNATEVTVPTASSRQNAYNELAEAYPGKQTDSVSSLWASNYYAIVYTPVKLVDNSTYYYTYTYTDDQDQLWTIGHSAQFAASDEDDMEAALYNTSLGNLYTVKADTEQSRLYALKESAATFVSHIAEAATEQAVDHRIAVVGFASTEAGDGNNKSEVSYENTELFIGSMQYNYLGNNGDRYGSNSSDPASEHYHEAFQSVTTEEGRNNLTASINALVGEGGTFPNHGFEIAQGIANANNTSDVYKTGQRKLVVVFMTDGSPGRNSFSSSIAEATVALATELETNYNATVYTVAVMNQSDISTQVGNFLSNSATSGTYTLASTGVDLTNFFHSIESEVQSTTADVKLTEEAFLVDRVSEYFSLPADISQDTLKNYLTIQKAQHIGDHQFANPVNVDFVVNSSSADTETEGKINVWLTDNAAGTTPLGITVHDWNFISSENLVTTSYAGDNITATGNKLIITITGITAKDGAAIDGYVPTNDDYSGIWDQTVDTAGQPTGQYGLLKQFPMPYANIVERIYVLDYAKDAKLDTLSGIRKALAVDSAHDGVFSPLNTENNYVAHKELTPATNGNATEDTADDYQSVKFGRAYIDDTEQKLRYTPLTTNWYGYDTLYVFWTSQTDDAHTGVGDPVTGNGWSKVNVMPANNVYYEDTFVETSTDGTTETGRVGIEFGEGWSFTTVEGENTEKPESAGQGETLGTHGWISSLDQENGFTDGTVATGTATTGDDATQATATFTFTGTGVDLYSYTDKTTGTIIVKVEPVQVRENYTIGTSYYIVDNYAASADDPDTPEVEGYYSIPTVSFTARGKDADGNEALVYGEYKVTIIVTAAAEGRQTYYLDGIRVYNPLGSEQENNPTVSEGYGDEVHAFFYNIREYLIDSTHYDAQYTVSYDKNGGTVPTDENGAEVAVTSVTVNHKGADFSTCPFVAPDGKQFAGWSLTADGEVISGTQAITSDTVLYAVWTDLVEGAEEAPAAYALNLVAEFTNFKQNGAVLIDEIKEGQVDGEEAGVGVTTNAIGTYEDYGPKNEVYLASGRSIVLKVDVTEGHSWFVSLKSPTGTFTTAKISNGDATADVDVTHTADMYYKVVPYVPDKENNPTVGYISIQNTGDAMLSVTKFQITGLDPNPSDDHFDTTGPDTGETGGTDQQSDPGLAVQSISADEAVTFARTFALMRSAPYAPNTDDTEHGSDAEEQEPENPDIEITNPDVEPEPDPETPDEPSAEEQAIAMVKALVERLFKSVLDWFNA